jgi:alanyl-tRNA synthetase
MSRTDRLYYNHTTSAFDATIVRTEPRGGRTAVWLDRTAFYPTSGGQPHDTGTLAGLPIVDVFDDEDGDVVHVVDGIAPAVGAQVHGQIDSARRLDHMQQHTGQHLLSAVLERLFDAKTVSVHLGSTASTIDIDREMSGAQLADAERESNAAIWRNTPVSIRYATEDEARLLPLRKESVRTGTLRLIEIEGVDLSACGGTHVSATGAIGQIVLTAWERFKGGQRLEFRCGGRALAQVQYLRDATADAVRQLSVLPSDLAAAIARLQDELKAQARTLAAAQLDLAAYQAASWADTGERRAWGSLVMRVVEGDAVRLRALASALATREGLLAVLVSPSTPALAVAARSADVPIACHDLIAALAKGFAGRGGGKPDLAQCGGLHGSPDAILAAVRAFLG